MGNPKKGKKPNLVQTWAKFSNLLILLKKAWEAHQEVWMASSREERETVPPEYQKFTSKNFNRSKFDVMLPRLVDYWRTIGGVEALKPILKKEKEKR